MTSPAAKKKYVVRCAVLGLAAYAAAMPWWSAADVAPPDPAPFTAAEIRSIVSHGPWPATAAIDPSNRVSGNLAAIELGTVLFFESRLSGIGTVSCGTCHVPERNWTDNQHRGTGVRELDRNTPTLMNVRLARWFGWDGGADSLWSQSIRPILDARELGASARHVAEVVRKDEQLSCRYRKAYGAPPSPGDDDAVLVDVAKALAAFQETLQSGRTPFDEFRDAVARGEQVPGWRYSEPAQRGLRLFIGKAGCSSCHTGPNFSNGAFHDNGLTKARAGYADPGRYDGIRQVQASPFNLLGRFNDDATRSNADGTRQIALHKRHLGQFKVPSLRNTVLTAPYGHDGEVATIAAVVKHYAELEAGRVPPGERLLKPVKLTEAEQSDLVVFLESLSTFTNPWRPEDGGLCQ